MYLSLFTIKTYMRYTKASPEILQEVFQIKDQGHYFVRSQRDFVNYVN